MKGQYLKKKCKTWKTDKNHWDHDIRRSIWSKSSRNMQSNLSRQRSTRYRLDPII